MTRTALTRTLLAWSLAVTALPALTGAALAAEGDDDKAVSTVIFSYERWTRAGDKRYVLVPAPARIAPGAFPDRIRELFRKLVAEKRNSYGEARLAFQPDADKTGVVFVYLDDSKQAYNPIVMAETVYTFTENGASKVVFPKAAPDGWTRADVPYPAYVLKLPLWLALPPAADPVALVELPDGSLLPSGAARDRLQKADKALVDAMWSAVDKGGAPALAAVNAAPVLKLPDLEDRLVPVLKSADLAMREAALAGLAGHDDAKVNGAVRALMESDPDAGLRDKAAAMLSASKDPAFSAAAQYHALKSADPKIVAAAAKALGDTAAKEAGDQLLAVLGHADAGVRAAAIASIQKRNENAALAGQLDNAKLSADAKLEIARALANGKDAPTIQAGLRWLAVNGKGNDSAGAATALVKYDVPETYSTLGKALRHPEAETRRAAASALSRLGKPAALPVLASADVADQETGEAVVTAIRTVYAAQSLDTVLDATKERTPVLRQAAVATLGDLVQRDGKKAQKKVLEALRTLAGDKDALIRASAVRSFEVMGDAEVKGDVLKLAGDASLEVKRAVAHAMRVFPGAESVKDLLGYTKEKDPELLANALGSLGVLKERQAVDQIINNTKNDDVRVRRAATGALANIGQTLEPDKRAPLLSFFSDALFDKDPEVRLNAVNGLRLVKDPRTVTAMAALLQDPVVDVRKATLAAMAETGDASAVDAIASGLDDGDATVRRAALDALRKLNRKEAVQPLTDYAKKEADAGLADEARKLIQTLKGS
jgi:HEAT repeat protein